MLRLKPTARLATPHSPALGISELGLLTQQLFTKLLWLERKRTERSGRGFVLMLLDPGQLLNQRNQDELLTKILSALSQAIRDTDITGWYKDGNVLGVIFTELGADVDGLLVNTLSTKVTEAMYRTLTVGQINEINLTFHVFPEDWDDNGPGGPVNSSLHVALAQGPHHKSPALQIKRLMDIVGSFAAIILCLPVFVGIALAIKLTSKGPVSSARYGWDNMERGLLSSNSGPCTLKRSEHSPAVREAVYRRRCSRLAEWRSVSETL